MSKPTDSQTVRAGSPPGQRYTYQQTGRYFAQISEGLEPLAERELRELGATEVKPGFRGLYFWADPESLYRVTYHTRLIQKIVAPLVFMDCHSTKYLYRRAGQIAWTDFLSPAQTFAVVANVSNSHIRHSKYAALCLKDAIVDFFKARFDQRPSVDTRQPDVWFNLYIHNNRAVVGLEVSGGSLHRRHYRIAGHEASMQETLAAALIRLTGWQGQCPLVDPMCGSGTLLAEALMAYCRLPAAFLRDRFGFQRLPDYQPSLWERVRRQAERQTRPLPTGLVRGSDVSAEAVEAARANLARLPGGEQVELTVADYRDRSDLAGTVIVSNPPYGRRLRPGDMEAFYRDLGGWLKQHAPGATAYLYAGVPRWLEHLGLRADWKKTLPNGGLDGRYVKIRLYAPRRPDATDTA